MKTKSMSPQFIFRIAISIFAFVLAFIFFDQLPDSIPSHWNFKGEADGFSPKSYGAFILPGLALLLTLLLPIFRKIDPRSQNYDKFAGSWEVIQTIIVSFMVYIYFIQLYVTLNPGNEAVMTPAIIGGMGIMFMVLGNYMGKVRQNYFVGLRTPWALADPEVWQKSQRFAGKAFIIAGLIFLVEAYVQIYFVPVFIATVVLVGVLPLIYSYVIYRNKN